MFLKELKINGQDLIAAGIEKGPKIGQTLQTLLQEVIEEPEKIHGNIYLPE